MRQLKADLGQFAEDEGQLFFLLGEVETMLCSLFPEGLR